MKEKTTFFDCDSTEELICKLKQKYGDSKNRFTPEHRFPSSLIFFEDKDEYLKFLQKTPWEKITLSEIISESDTRISCYRLKKWFLNLLDEKRDEPFIILPITEYIRLCIRGEKNSGEIYNIFNRVVQAEGIPLIVPMLDYFAHYISFFNSFVHVNRSAEVFRVIKHTSQEENILEIILDNTRKIPEKDMDVVDSPKQWFKLWESGEISLATKILVRSKVLNNILMDVDITTPRIELSRVDSEHTLLSYLYNIDKKEIMLPVTQEVWDAIFSLPSHTITSNQWSSIVNHFLEKVNNLEELIPDLWENKYGKNGKIKRWFWLNEAKKQKFKSTFLNSVVDTLEEPDKLLDIIYLKPLEDIKCSIQELEDRRTILKNMHDPLFATGTSDLESKFIEWIDNTSNEFPLDQRLHHFTGIFSFEKKQLINIIIEALTHNIEVARNILPMIRHIWPTLATYIEPLFIPMRNIAEVEIVKDPQLFFEEYRREYIRSKILYDAPTSQLLEMHNLFQEHWGDILAARIVGKLPDMEDEPFIKKCSETGFIFIDAVGYEWIHVLEQVFEEYGWTVINSYLVTSSLPSDTKYFPLKGKEIIKYGKFDELIHKRYSYPERVFEELYLLEKIISEIHERYRSHPSSLWVVSDHGSTAFARKGETTDIEGVVPSHGGRYARTTKKIIAGKENVYTIPIGSCNNESVNAIMLSYTNLASSAPQGEAHGGATPEEISALALEVFPPGANSPTAEFSIEPEQPEYNLLDERLQFIIKGHLPCSMDSVQMRVNKQVRFDPKTIKRERETISVSMGELKKNGLSTGLNSMEFFIRGAKKYIAEMRITSGAKETNFDDIFDL